MLQWYGDLHLIFEEHTNTMNVGVLFRMWLNVLVSKRYERGQKHLNGLIIQSMLGAGGSEWCGLATGSHLQVALLKIIKPLHDLLPEFFVGPDLVHGERTAVERVCLVARTKKTKPTMLLRLLLNQITVSLPLTKTITIVFCKAEIKLNIKQQMKNFYNSVLKMLPWQLK